MLTVAPTSVRGTGWSSSMIARIQRASVVLWCLALMSLLARLCTRAATPWTVAGLLVFILGMPIVLVLQFATMTITNRGDPGYRVPIGTVLRAWAGELAAAIRVFGWWQPFRSDALQDCPDAGSAGGRAVLLVHGFGCNRGFWLPWLQRLRNEGRSYIALTLEPPWGPIERYAAAIEAAVMRLERQTGMPPVIVAHSMGGLAVRNWWVQTRVDRIHRLITLGSPHHGTVLARLGHLPNVRQMRRHNAWLQALFEREGEERRRRASCFWSLCDNIVFPADTATLEGAANHRIVDTGHVAMVGHPAPWLETQRWLIVGARAGGARGQD